MTQITSYTFNILGDPLNPNQVLPMVASTVANGLYALIQCSGTDFAVDAGGTPVTIKPGLPVLIQIPPTGLSVAPSAAVAIAGSIAIFAP